MKPIIRPILISALLIFCLIAQAFALQNGEIKQTFKNVKEIRIKTVSGDCIVNKGNNDEVKVVLTYTYDDYDYEPELEQMGDRLILTERFHSRRSTRGRSTWRLIVPEKTEIDFSTASGDLEVSDLKSFIDASTASGDVTLSNINGECEISTASGEIDAKALDGRVKFSTASGDVDLTDSSGELRVSTASGKITANKTGGEMKFSAASGTVRVSDSSGEFELSAASGDVDAMDIIIEAKSSFSAASGDVEVSLAKSLEHDLKVSAASGDAVLNFNNNAIKGFIEMTAKARRGRIKAPFKFDDEEYYYKWDNEYVTKTVTKGSNSPRIEISTASGKAVLLGN